MMAMCCVGRLSLSTVLKTRSVHGAVVDATVSSGNDKTWKSLALKIEEHFGEVVLIDDWIHTTKPLQMPKTVEQLLVEGDLL